MTDPSKIFVLASPAFARSRLDAMGLTGTAALAAQQIRDYGENGKVQKLGEGYARAEQSRTAARNISVTRAVSARSRAEFEGRGGRLSVAQQMLAENPGDPLLCGNVAPDRPLVVSASSARDIASQPWKTGAMARGVVSLTDLTAIDGRPKI